MVAMPTLYCFVVVFDVGCLGRGGGGLRTALRQDWRPNIFITQAHFSCDWQKTTTSSYNELGKSNTNENNYNNKKQKWQPVKYDLKKMQFRKQKWVNLYQIHLDEGTNIQRLKHETSTHSFFGIALVNNSNKTRTCWYRWPFSLFHQYQFTKKHV